MTWPTPKIGQIVRYAYLWKREADQKQEEGVKDRPCVIVVALQRAGGRTQVVVAPITHTHPLNVSDTIALPIGTARRCGLDGYPQWISAVDLNRFTWPGPDLRPLPGQDLSTVVIGKLPRKVLQILLTRLAETVRSGRAAITTRTE